MARIGLKDVAQAAKVSHMTVSRVVRGEQTVADQTAAKVRRFIKTMDYQPDPALSALAAYRSRGRSPRGGNVLAFLETEKSDYNALVLEGVRAEATRLGYTVHAFALPASAKGQGQLNRELFHRGIMGLLVSPSSEPRRLDGWDWRRFAAVSMGALRHEPPMHAVAMDYFHGLQTAYAGLRARGQRRIGLILGREAEARTGHHWLGAYLSISQPTLKPLLYDVNAPMEKALRPWLKQQKPDAILTIDRSWHHQLTKARVASGYLNDIAPYPSAPCIRLDPRHIGTESVRLMNALLQRRELGLPKLPKMILLRGEWDEDGVSRSKFKIPNGTNKITEELI